MCGGVDFLKLIDENIMWDEIEMVAAISANESSSDGASLPQKALYHKCIAPGGVVGHRKMPLNGGVVVAVNSSPTSERRGTTSYI